MIADLAGDPSPGVRAALACLLASKGPDPRSTRIVVELLDGPDERHRIAGLDALRRLGDPVPVERVRRLLADPSPGVRAAAVEALAVSSDVDASDPDIVAALDDDAGVVRITAARALSGRETTPAGLREVLARGSTRAQEAALVAMRGHGPDVREAVIAWALGRLERAARLRQARLGMATDGRSRADPSTPSRAVAPPSAAAFLDDVLARRERGVVEGALGAMVVLGAYEAGGVIRRCLRSDDPETRAQAIEALDAVGDRELPGALIRLLEGDPQGTLDRAAVLATLVDEDDPWIGRLARRVIDEEVGMPETSRTLGDLETMLMLRRVPIFQGLDPEDLQRIAMTAVEHLYPADQPIVHEGDVGDELVVIVEGSVRVVRAEPDGTERLIRGYEAGDHFGELAVLREAPRAATVIAEGDGVRGLVIGGEGLRAILRERPDAAMAMLATLAERISRQ